MTGRVARIGERPAGYEDGRRAFLMEEWPAPGDGTAAREGA